MGVHSQIVVDADACPVKEIIERAAARHGVKVRMVTATAMRDRPGVEVIRIPGGPDAVDDWIVAHCEPDDIVVTQDIPLAAEVIAKGAIVIENRGELFTAENIGSRLMIRNLTMELRETGVLEFGGPKAMSARDKQRFAQTLGRLLDPSRKG